MQLSSIERRLQPIVGNRRLLALAVAAIVVAFLSLEFTREAGRVASIWPLNALLLAAAIRWRDIDWRTILAVGAAADLAVNVAMGDTIVRAALLTLANAIEVVVCIYLLRVHRKPFEITRTRDLLRFIGAAGVVAPAVSSCVAALALISEARFADTYSVWFAADALGLLIFTPALLALASSDASTWHTAKPIEASLSLAGVTAGSILVFAQSAYPLLFVIPPLLILATFRLGIRGAGAALLIVTFGAISFAVSGHGPTQLVDGTVTERVVVLQAFLALMSISTLPVAAALAEGRRATKQLESARDQAEHERLRAMLSETRYRSLADHASDIVVRFGPDGVITYASPSIRILGFTPEQAIGRTTADFTAPEDRAFATQMKDQLFTGSEPDRSIRRKFRVVHADGVFMWFEGNPSIIRDEQGRPVEVVSAYRDITAQHMLETALEEARDEAARAAQAAKDSEARYRTMAEMSRDMVSRTSFDSVIRFVSPSAETIMGFTPAELIGTTTLGHMHPDEVDRVRSFFQNLIAEGPTARPRPYSFRAKRKDGRYIWLEGIPRILFDANGKPLEIQDTVRDITLRKEMEQALLESKHAAEAAAKAKADFLANMSHELRTPLNSVVGYARVLTQSTSIEGDDRRYIELIGRSSRALLGIVNDVLDLSAIDAGGLRLDHRPFSPTVTTQQVADEFAPLAEAKGLSLAVTFSGAEFATLVGDDGRLRQILTNLIGNALKFTDQGDVSVFVQASKEAAGRQHLRFSVHDTGVGVQTDEVEALFGRFTQADTSVSRRYGGTGLGLAISKNLVELMGGAIGAAPRADGGSTFWFELTLPIASEPQTERAGNGLPAPAQETPRRILVVDDLEENRELLSLMLQGHIVDQAASGAAALEMISAHTYDLVLMDVQMPGMDGKSATNIIRQEPAYAKLPVVAVSAHALPDRIASFMAAGMDDYLAKPIDPAALEAVILKWTGREHVVEAQPSADVMAALREKFVARCQQDLSALSSLSPRNDAKEVRAIMHRLAGSAATFGYPEAGRVALVVDQAYSAGAPPSHEEIKAVTRALQVVCKDPPQQS